MLLKDIMEKSIKGDGPGLDPESEFLVCICLSCAHARVMVIAVVVMCVLCFAFYVRIHFIRGRRGETYCFSVCPSRFSLQ